MQKADETIQALGNEPPLIADGRSGPPDRREVSARWLSGTFLTGVTSSVLLGFALMAALDGRDLLATPAERASLVNLDAVNGAAEASKSDRLTASRTLDRGRDRRRMEVSTLIRTGEHDVVRTLPFIQARIQLAAGHTTSRNYPNFDPLEVFAEEGVTKATATTGLIYGARVESEVSLRTLDFPLDAEAFDESIGLTADEVEQVVRNTGAILTDGDIQIAALHYVDPLRFGDRFMSHTLGSTYNARIVAQNVSYASREVDNNSPVFAEDIIPVADEREIAEIFYAAGYSSEDGERMAEALGKLLDRTKLSAGSTLRVGVESQGEYSRIMRATLYEGRRHRLTIAVNDRDQFVRGEEPEANPVVLAALGERQPEARPRSNLPTIYDGIYRAAFSYGLTSSMSRQIIRMLAADVDFQSRLQPTDRIEVLFSRPDAENHATEESELLFVSATFGGTTRNFYRFQMEDGTIDYFDDDGRSARQFLLRNPVPNGRFTSGFGMRRHPVLGYSRMHTGVDWAAPRGTPIIASGNGVVQRAGWSGGYGRQVIIRHANGYETSYSHMHAIADNVSQGSRIRQGQVIGYVGATGLATGNHLHYELHVNGNPVDPMRVRLPNSRELDGDELIAFQDERQRIVSLLENEGIPAFTLASN
jgi:murein DD-endopeptidase MepM/ murein hydrolase activator NlpD